MLKPTLDPVAVGAGAHRELTLFLGVISIFTIFGEKCSAMETLSNVFSSPLFSGFQVRLD